MAPTSISNMAELYQAVGQLQGQFPSLISDVQDIKKSISELPDLRAHIENMNGHVEANVDPHIQDWLAWKNRVVGMVLVCSTVSFILGMVATILAIKHAV